MNNRRKVHSSTEVKTKAGFKISSYLLSFFIFCTHLGVGRKWACLSAVCHMTVSGGRNRALP